MTTSRADGPGLRERKKARTRAAIQQHALRLFIEQGYAQTTVDQIAAAAEVSQSTFFRYFATKEDTVLYDQFDPIMIESFLRQPASMSPLAAVRAALREIYLQAPAETSALEMARMRLISSVPELRAAAADQAISGLTMLAEAAAERTGRSPSDIGVRTWAGAVLGVGLSAFWSVADAADFGKVLDDSLALLEAGLPI